MVYIYICTHLTGSLLCRGVEPEPQQREAYVQMLRKFLPNTRGAGQLEVVQATQVGCIARDLCI
jgi:hypothetical protein